MSPICVADKQPQVGLFLLTQTYRMEKEKLSSELKGLVGENSLSERTWNEYIDNSVVPFLPSEEDKVKDYLAKHATSLKSLNGQLNFDVAGKVNEFKKTYKPETPANPQAQPPIEQPSNQNDEVAKKLKELDDFKKSLEQRYESETKAAQRNSLIADAKKKATDQGAVDETVLSFVLPLINPSDNDTADTLSAIIKTRYDEAYTKLKGGGYNPAAGNSSISVNPVLSSEAKRLREKAAEERKKMKV